MGTKPEDNGAWLSPHVRAECKALAAASGPYARRMRDVLRLELLNDNSHWDTGAPYAGGGNGGKGGKGGKGKGGKGAPPAAATGKGGKGGKGAGGGKGGKGAGPCWRWENTGSCAYGGACRFAHPAATPAAVAAAASE
mmetsp:Transcript_33932/g.69357  ORF Transcript_33932/g.69357 Transcript_33932/m.69357 type:complete len:138 (+) Transcript_33932:1603-2016(+)